MNKLTILISSVAILLIHCACSVQQLPTQNAIPTLAQTARTSSSVYTTATPEPVPEPTLQPIPVVGLYGNWIGAIDKSEYVEYFGNRNICRVKLTITPEKSYFAMEGEFQAGGELVFKELDEKHLVASVPSWDYFESEDTSAKQWQFNCEFFTIPDEETFFALSEEKEDEYRRMIPYVMPYDYGGMLYGKVKDKKGKEILSIALVRSEPSKYPVCHQSSSGLNGETLNVYRYDYLGNHVMTDRLFNYKDPNGYERISYIFDEILLRKAAPNRTVILKEFYFESWIPEEAKDTLDSWPSVTVLMALDTSTGKFVNVCKKYPEYYKRFVEAAELSLRLAQLGTEKNNPSIIEMYNKAIFAARANLEGKLSSITEDEIDAYVRGNYTSGSIIVQPIDTANDQSYMKIHANLKGGWTQDEVIAYFHDYLKESLYIDDEKCVELFVNGNKCYTIFDDSFIQKIYVTDFIKDDGYEEIAIQCFYNGNPIVRIIGGQVSKGKADIEFDIPGTIDDNGNISTTLTEIKPQKDKENREYHFAISPEGNVYLDYIN